MRATLPHRRRSETLQFEHEKQRYTATVGYYRDGRIGEIFIDCGKSGTELQNAMRDCAVLASFAFQHGCCVATVRRAMSRNPDGSAAGPMGVLLDMLEDDEDGEVMVPIGPQPKAPSNLEAV